jgi:hypothetical protein
VKSVLLALLALLALRADDADTAWSQGRPAESLARLVAEAQAGNDWGRWLDAGLCAAAAEDRGHAVAYLLTAHRLAPAAAAPRQALAALGCPPPGGWLDVCGPIALPGLSWWGPLTVGLGTGLLAFALLAPRRRPWLAGLGGALLLAAAPGVVAQAHDRQRPLAAVVRDSELVDAAGRTLAQLPAGTVLTRLPGAPWAGRSSVQLADGRQGFTPTTDLEP